VFTVLMMKIPVLLYYPEDKGKNLLLTLILLTWRIWWAANNASKWQMGFKSAFKGLKVGTHVPVWMVTHPRRWTVWYIVWLLMLEQIRKKLSQKNPTVDWLKWN